MKAMIFAAGLGTRLKPLTDTMPKALVPLAGKSLLQWQVEKLRDAGITDIIVNVHHFPDMIIDAVRAHEGWGCKIAISDERDCLLDTGGGLKKAVSEGPVLACNVDILSNINIPAFINAYAQSGISQLVVSDRQTQRYLCFDETDTLCGWTNIATGEVRPENFKFQISYPKGTIVSNFKLLAFSGMQILSPDALALLDMMPEGKFSLIDFYLRTMQRVPFRAYVPANYQMMDVGKINEIEKAERFAALLVSPERLELSTH